MNKESLLQNKDQLLSYTIEDIIKGAADSAPKHSISLIDVHSERTQLLQDREELKCKLIESENMKRKIMTDFMPDSRRMELLTSNIDESLLGTTTIETSLQESCKIFVHNNSLFVYGAGDRNDQMYEINIETGASRLLYTASKGIGYANIARIPNKNCVVIQGGEQPSYGSTKQVYVHTYGEEYGSSRVTSIGPSNTKYLSFSYPIKYREDECGIYFIGGYADRMSDASYSLILNSDITSTAREGYLLYNYDASGNYFYVLGGCANIISKEEAQRLYPNAAFPSENSLSIGEEYIYFEYRFGIESNSSSKDEAFARNKISLMYGKTTTKYNDKGPTGNLHVIGERQYEGHSDFEANFCDFTQITVGSTTYDIYIGYSKKEPVLQVVADNYYKRITLPIAGHAFYIDEVTKIAYMFSNKTLYTLDLHNVIPQPKILYKKQGMYYKEEGNSLVSLNKSEVSPEDFAEHGASEANKALSDDATICVYCDSQINSLKVNGKITPQVIRQTKPYSVINSENKITFPMLTGQQDIVKIAFSNNNGYSWRTIKDGEIEVMRLEDIATEGFSPEDAFNLSRKKTMEMLSDKICFAYYIDNNNDKVTICPPIISNISSEAVYYGENKDLSYEAPYIKKANEDISELGFISVVPTMSDVTMSSAEVTEVIDEEEKTYAITKIDIPSIADLKSYYITVKNIEEE